MEEIERYIKATLRKFDLKSRKINLANHNLKEHSNRYYSFQDEGGNKFKLYVFNDRLSLEIKADSSLLFAINLPDHICLANKESMRLIGKCMVYTDQQNEIKVLDAINSIEKDVEQLNLESNEGLFVYGNSINLVLLPARNLLSEVKVLTQIKFKIENKHFTDIDIDYKTLPEELHSLISLLDNWAISDDVEREEKLNTTSKIELYKLVTQVTPKIDIINKYLNSFKNTPLPPEAIAVGNLAELVTEINLS